VKRPSLAIAVAVSAAALALGLAACGGGDDTETSAAGGGGGAQKLDLTVGNLVPLTGDLAPYGPAGEKAGKLAVQEINAAIKKAGVDHTVTLATEDGQSSDQGGVQAARKLIADGASCISGDYASTATVADARSVTINEGVMLISPASTADAVTDLDDDGLVSRTAPPDSLQGKALADRMEKAIPGGLNGKTINIGARNDLYGTGFSESLQQELEGRGAKVAENVVYDTEQPTYNSEAQQIVSGNPDYFVIIDFPEPFDKVGPALLRTGKWDPKKTFITDGLSDDTLPQTVGNEIADGLQGTAPGTFSGSAPDAFDKLYNQAPGAPRNLFDSTTFDDMILCYLGAVAAGSAEGDLIADNIVAVTGPPGQKYTFEQLPQAIKALQNGQDIDYEGASGPINWNDAGDLTQYVYDIQQFKNGKLVKLQTVQVKAD
jgi:branched-chain amino acid transport system substrate-binding protein